MKTKILVMCTGNAFRSQMAEAYIRRFGGDRVEVSSCGVKPSGVVSRWAVRALAEEGIDISGAGSDHLDRYLDQQFDILLTVCDHAHETCPIFPNPVKTRIHKSFPDYPPKGDLSDEAFMELIRSIRDSIREYCRELCEMMPFY